MKHILWFLFVVLFYHTGIAQSKWQGGVSIGGSSYIGDINPRNFDNISGVHSEVHIRRSFDGYLGASFQYSFGIIKGDDAQSKVASDRLRNLNFNTNLNELSLTLEFNFFEFMQGIGKHRFTPYIFGGAGILMFQPTAIYNGNRYDLAEMRTEGQEKSYSKTVLTIPYGIGARYALNENLSLQGKIGFREAMTDYLDDVSGFYPNTTNFDLLRAALADRSGEISGNYIGVAGLQRGDLRKRDKYMFVGIGISYTFVNSKCY